MKFTFIAKHRSIWPVAWMCSALGLSRSGFHASLSRSPSKRAQDDEEIGTQVRSSFIGSARTYSARRVWRDVLSLGIDCGLHRIERLMRARLERQQLSASERLALGNQVSVFDHLRIRVAPGPRRPRLR